MISKRTVKLSAAEICCPPLCLSFLHIMKASREQLMLQTHQRSGGCQVAGEYICILSNPVQLPPFGVLSDRVLFWASIHNKLHCCHVSSYFFCMSNGPHEYKNRRKGLLEDSLNFPALGCKIENRGWEVRVISYAGPSATLLVKNKFYLKLLGLTPTAFTNRVFLLHHTS